MAIIPLNFGNAGRDGTGTDLRTGAGIINENFAELEQAVEALGDVVGANGEDGVGVPVGGAAGDVLRKSTGVDYETEWAKGVFSDVAATGGSAVTNIIRLTQAQFDAINPKDPDTFYIVPAE